MDQTVSGINADQEPGTEQEPGAKAPRALKIAVIMMGILLVAGFATVIITIAYRSANPSASSSPAAAGESGFETLVPLLAGAEIIDTTVAGIRSLVTVRRPDGTYEVIVLDLGKGRMQGRFVLAPE